MSSSSQKIKSTKTEEKITVFPKKKDELKKFGLVWEDKKEDVAERCKTNLPLLKEVKTKKIITDIKKPTNIIIEGDNYHALSVLNYTHAGKIDVIYIDPPYNTGKKDWKYNNDYVDKEDAYRHSKWLSFMSKRILLAKKLLTENGILICAIDYREKCRLGLLLEEIFLNKEITFISVIHNPKGKQGEDFSYTHEYACFIYHKKSIQRALLSSPTNRNLRDSGGESDRTNAKNCFYPFIVKRNGEGLIVEDVGDVCKDNYSPKKQTIKVAKDTFHIFPIDDEGKEKKWRRANDTAKEELHLINAKERDGKIQIHIKKNEGRYKTVWHDKKFDATYYGTGLLKQILGREINFPFPKSLYTVKECLEAACKNNPNAIILDFFAGSGTTGHAVLEMNKQDNGNRQFILCTDNENNICEEVTYPRIKSVINGYKFEGKKRETLLKEGLGGNISYFKTTFIPYSVKPTDSTKAQIMKNATDILCIKENAFEEVINEKGYKIFKSYSIYMGILFDSLQFFKFKDKIKKLSEKKCRIYIFSFVGDDKFEKSFDDLKNVKIVSVPEVILRVYKRLFLKR